MIRLVAVELSTLITLFSALDRSVATRFVRAAIAAAAITCRGVSVVARLAAGDLAIAAHDGRAGAEM